jgi:hypothetical protein
VENFSIMSQESLSGPPEPAREIRRFDFQALARFCNLLCRRFSSVSRSRRYAVASVVLLLAMLGAYELFFSDSAQLRIICQHSFRSAQLTVTVNGKVVCETTLAGSSRKRFGLLPGSSAAGTYSTVVNVPAGKDLVEVRVSAPSEGFNETRALSANVRQGEQNLLAVNTSRSSGLVLRSPGSAPANLAGASGGNGFSLGFFSVLFSALGTMFSASVSFMVQEFWRSHKNRTRT